MIIGRSSLDGLPIFAAKRNLEKTKEYLRLTRNAVISRGGTISPTAGLIDLPEAILNVPQDASVAFHVNDAVSYRKSVPSGATGLAYLNSIGGMTYKIPDTFVATVTEVYDAGLIAKAEFEYIPSIPFQLSQPSEDAGWTFRALLDARPFGLDRDYWLQGSQIYLNDDTTPVNAWSIPTDVVIRKISGYLDDNMAELFNVPIGTQIVCTPLFVDWDTEAYFDLPAPLRNAKPTAVKSYKADGTLLAEYTLPTAITDKLGLGYDANLFNEYSFVEGEAIERVNTTVVSSTIGLLGVLKSRDRVGIKLPADANAIDALQITTTKAKLLTPYFDNDYTMKQLNDTSSLVWQVGGMIYSTGQHAWFFFPEGTFATKEEAEAWFNERQLPIVYEKTEYVKTPITTDFNPLIKVEAGGSIEFVNEYGKPVPSTVTFAIRVGG